MMTPKQRVAALLEHVQDSCSLNEIIFYLETLVRWDSRGTTSRADYDMAREGEKFDLNWSEEWEKAWAAEAARRIAYIDSGVDEGIPAEKVIAEARARYAK
jgi:hypothetical protein